jgi:hypothetical protein
MKEEILDISKKLYHNHLTPETATNLLLSLFSVSKRHLLENIIDDVKQSHSEYAVEKIESYLDDGC